MPIIRPSNQSLTVVATSNTTLGTSGAQPTSNIVIAGAGNVSVGVSNGSIVVSGQGGGVGIGAGTQTTTSGNVIFANANGVSFGLNAGTLTASYTVPNVPAQTVQSYNIVAAGTQTAATSGTVVYSNSNNVSFGMSNNSVVTASASFNQTVQTQNMVSVLGSTGNISFANGNNVTFGTNGSTITASVLAQSVQTQSTAAVLGSTGNISFANGNGVTFGGNVSTVTASVGAGATATGNFGALGAGTQTATSGTVSFANSNGISFGMSGSNQITASYTVPNVPAQTVQTLGGYVVGNTTGQSSSSTFDARTLSFSGAGVASVGYSAGNIIISVPAGGGATMGAAAGTQTATSGTVVYSNSNNVSFGMSNSSVITASASFNQTVQTQNMVSVLGSTGNISFANANGVTFGTNGSTISASVGAGATATGNFGALGAGTQTATSGTVSFANSNGISFGMSGSNQITASYTVPSQSVQTYNVIAAGTQTANTSGSVVFSNSNNVSFGMSNSSIVTASFSQSVQTQSTVAILGSTGAVSFANGNGVTFGGNVSTITASVGAGATATGNFGALGAGTQTATSGTVSFANSNGISFGMSGSNQITASYTVPTQSVQTVGGYAVGNTTGQSSSSTFDARTLSFSGAGIVSVGYSGGNVIISAVAAGAGDGVNILAAGTQTATSNGTVVFQNSNGISFGMSNSSQITASVAAGATATGNFGALGAGTQTATSGTVSFANSNGISFGMSGSNQITASYTVPAQTVQSYNIIAAGTQTAATSGTVVYSNSNNVSFGMSNSSVITASASFNQTVQTQGLIPAISGTNSTGGGSSFSGSTLQLMQANGFSFIISSNSVSGSYTVPTQTVQTAGLYAVGNTTGQSSSSTYDARTISYSGAGIVSVGNSGGNFIISAVQSVQTQNSVAVLGSSGNISFANANGVTFGGNVSTVTASVGAGATATGNFGALGAGTQTATSGTVSFANSNGISFGMSGSNQITASYTVPTQTVQSYNIIAAGTQTAATSGTVVYSNSNNVSFGMSNSSVITASASFNQTVQTQGLIPAVSGTNSTGGGSSFSGSTMQLMQANGFSFIVSSNSISGSYTVPTQSVQTLGSYAVGNTTGQSSSSTFDARTMSISGAGIVSVGYSGGNLIISASAAGAADGVNILAAGTQTANTTGTVVFSNSNNVTFGMTNSSIITASFSQSVQTQNLVSVLGSTGAISFANGNGVTFGGNASTVTASVGAGATATGNFGALGAGTQTATSGTVSFANSNGISFGMSGSNQITASYTVPAQTVQTAGLYAVGNTTGQSSSSTYDARTISYSGAGIISIGNSGGNFIISATQSVQTQSTVAILGSTGAISFANANGITFGANVSTVTASVAAGATATGNFGALGAGTQTATSGTVAFANSNGISFGMSGSNQITASYTVPAQTVQTLGGYAVGNTTGQSSSSTFDARTLSFSGAGIASVGYSAGNIIISVPSGGGAGDGVNILAAGTQTANTTGTVVFSNSNNVSFGMSNNSIITASMLASNLTAGANITLSSAGSTVSIIGPAANVIQMGTTGTTGTTFSSAAGTVLLNGVNMLVSQDGSNNLFVVDSDGASLMGNTAGVNTFFNTDGTLYLAGGNNITLSGNGRTITISAGAGGAGATGSWFQPEVWGATMTTAHANGTVYIRPFDMDGAHDANQYVFQQFMSSQLSSTLSISASVSAGNASSGSGSWGQSGTVILFSHLNSANTNASYQSIISFQSNTYSMSAGYSASVSWSTNASSATASWTTSGALGWINNINSTGGVTSSSIGTSGSSTFSSTSTNANSFSSSYIISAMYAHMSGMRPLRINAGGNANTGGQQWLGMIQSTATGSTNMSFQRPILLASTGILYFTGSSNNSYLEYGSSANIASSNWRPGFGSYSASSNTTTAFPLSAITSMSSNASLWFAIDGNSR